MEIVCAAPLGPEKTKLDLGDGALDLVDDAGWVDAPRGGEVHPASATAASATAHVIARPPVMSRPSGAYGAYVTSNISGTSGPSNRL